MATLVLSAGLNAAFPAAAGSFAWGSVLGGLIGGVIDNQILFPPPDVKGPRLGDMQFQSSSEGTPTNFVLSNENRVSGWVIWKSKTIETEHESGGKGGPTSTQYTYSCDIAIAVAENELTRIPRIWANGNLIYDADADIDIASTQISVTKVTVREWTWTGTSNQWMDVVYGDLSSPSGGPDLSQLRTGLDTVCAGFASSNNNGTFRCVSSSMDTATGISKARVRNPLATTASSGASVTLHQDIPEFSTSKMASAPTFYLGTESQLPDPTIQSYEGAANVPAHRGTAYVVLHGFQLGDFGNSVPQFTFDAEQSASPITVATAISTIMARSGRSSSEWDVTGVTGNLRGYVIRGPQTLTQQLRPLLLAFDIVTQERRGKLYFFSRSSIARTAISTSKVTARVPGSEVKRRLQLSEVNSPQLPIVVNVKYIDNTNDYGDGLQTYRRFKEQGWGDNSTNVDLPITLSPSEAADIARRVLWTAWANKVQAKLTAAPSQLSICEGDVITLSALDGRDWELLVSKVDRSALDYLLELEALTEELQTLTFSGTPAEDASFNANVVYTVPEMTFSVADFGPLRSEDEQTPGLYWGGSFYDPSKQFLGASLYQSDDGTNYTVAEDVLAEATLGYAVTALSSTGISVAFWDNKWTVQVRLYNGTLSSKTELEVLNGANRAMLGREVIGFKQAALQSDGSYILSGLLRGLVATEDQIGTHVTGEEFMLLTGPGVSFRALSFNDIDRVRYFKIVALGGIVSQFNSRQIQLQCNTVSHFPVTQIRGLKDSVTSNWNIKWVRRSRGIFKLFGPTVAPLLDTVEKYDIEILNAAETAVLRTIQVTSATSYVYDNATAVADFGSNPSTLHVRIYQVHSITGRSKGLVAVLPIN